MRIIRCDVVVVGAGPAGSMTARSAAENGVNVVFLEEHASVGVPVGCAEGLSANGLNTSGLKPSPDVISQEINQVKVFAPDGHFLEIPSTDRKGYTINRDVFDQRLAERAVDAGAELMLETRGLGVIKEGDRVVGVSARHKDENLQIRARVVIGADSYYSLVRRTAGLGHWYPDVASCAQFRFEGLDLEEPDADEFYFGSNHAPGGYAWVFPKSSHAANVGLGVRGTQRSALECLRAFVQRDRRFRDKRSTATTGGVTPVSGLVEQITSHGVMLVGDAAGQLIPLTGGGVHAGMAAGRIAGEVAARAIRTGDVSRSALQEYERAYETSWGNRIRMSRKAVEMLDKMSDEDLNALSQIITCDDILDLANGQNTAKVLARLTRRAPGRILRLAKLYLST